MNATQIILDNIERRLDHVNTEIQRLNAARNALQAKGVDTHRPPAAKTRTSDARSRRPSAQPTISAASTEIAPPSSNDNPPPEPTAVQSSEVRQPLPRRRRRDSRRVAVVPAGKLEALLATTDGLSTAELAEHAGGRAPQILGLLRELERTGKVRRSGQRRTTRWHWITDEDRIQARAAELAALSTSNRRSRASSDRTRASR